MNDDTRPLYPEMNTNGNNGSVIRVTRLEYGADNTPAYAEYDGWGKLQSYTPVETRHETKWKPGHTIGIVIVAAILVWVAYTAYIEYLRDCERSEFMERAVLTKGLTVDSADKLWDQIHGIEPAKGEPIN